MDVYVFSLWGEGVLVLQQTALAESVVLVKLYSLYKIHIHFYHWFLISSPCATHRPITDTWLSTRSFIVRPPCMHVNCAKYFFITSSETMLAIIEPACGHSILPISKYKSSWLDPKRSLQLYFRDIFLATKSWSHKIYSAFKYKSSYIFIYIHTHTPLSCTTKNTSYYV